MVGKLGKIAALFGSKSSLNNKSAYPSTLTVYPEETRPERFKRSWSLRLSKRPKDHNRAANGGGKLGEPVKGGGVRSSPLPPLAAELSVPPPPAPAPQPPSPDPKHLAALAHAAQGAEAMAILVKHLVHNLDAFSAPQLKVDLEQLKTNWIRTKYELEETKLNFVRLREEYTNEKEIHDLALDEAYKNYEEEKNEMKKKFKEEFDKLSDYHKKKLEEIRADYNTKENKVASNFQGELDHLQRCHEAEMDRFRRDKAKNLEALTSDYERKLEAGAKREEELKIKIETLSEECEEIKNKSQVFMSTLGKDAKLKLSMQECEQLKSEVDSLRCVLDLRSSELIELRRQSQVWRRDAEQLPTTLGRVALLQTKLEELQARLAAKESIEQKLLQENKILNETIHKENSQRKRLSMHNEELQWKLKQNCEVVNALASLTGSVTTPKSGCRSAYALNKTASEADINGTRLCFEGVKGDGGPAGQQLSPPGSPVVKSVIEKNDSVAWVLDIDETPEIIASRILKRAQSLKVGGGSPSSPQVRPVQRKIRNRSSQSLSISPHSRSRSQSSPTTPESAPEEEDRGSGGGWESDHITEEVILVQSCGAQSVLELFDLENAEIHIDDVQKKEPSEEELRMIRRVEEPGARAEVLLPKDSAGEAMISGEASDDDEEEAEQSDSDEEPSSSSDDFSDKDCEFESPRPRLTSQQPPPSAAAPDRSWLAPASSLHSNV